MFFEKHQISIVGLVPEFSSWNTFQGSPARETLCLSNQETWKSDGFSHQLPAWWPGKRGLNVELVLEMFPLWAVDVSFTKLTVSLERKIYEAWIRELIQIKKRNGAEYSNSKPVFVLLNLDSTCLQAVGYIIMWFFMVHSHLTA